jgi:hypothetical protein
MTTHVESQILTVQLGIELHRSEIEESAGGSTATDKFIQDGEIVVDSIGNLVERVGIDPEQV